MLKIYGASDDIVMANVGLETACSKCGAEIEEPTNAVVCDREDQIDCYDRKVHFTIGDDKGGAKVTMFYAANGCWAASVGQLDEDVPIPWAVRIGTDAEARSSGPGHSVVVCVDCPNDTPVKVEKESTS